tara:strand:- start:208 stop:828 length:621 start_codon:yes stop_codon:yes gene_type:complete
MFFEPRWKSYIVTSNDPVFNKEQCNHIIRLGQSGPQEKAKVGTNKKNTLSDDPKQIHISGINDLKKRITTISWLPFDMPEAKPVYETINNWVRNININHFGFEGIHITEQAQYTEYPTGAFYDWHTDNDTSMENQPPVRKISMTLLLSDPADFEGGELELIDDKARPKMKQGHAIFFASFIRHRVKPVTKGNRKSLVMWFGGPPFK